jgi:dCMP deaminase
VSIQVSELAREHRPTIEDTLMRVAWAFSERGTCSRRQVGSVIADDRGVILSTGYNGALTGFPHCAEHYDYEPCETSSHSERNAIYWAARRGIALEGMQVYSTDSPCVACAKAMIQSGIVRLTYQRPYREDKGLLLLMAAKVEVVRYGE